MKNRCFFLFSFFIFNFAFMLRSLPRRLRMCIAIGAIIAVAAIGYGTLRADSYLTSTGFCSSACHEMQGHARLFRAQRHSVSMVGGCAGCHVPPGVAGHVNVKVSSAPQMWEHVFGQPDPAKFRAGPSQVRIINERCINCHVRRYTVDLQHIPLSRVAAVATVQGEVVPVACTGCHPGIGHYDGRYDDYAPTNDKRKSPEETFTDLDCLACHTAATPEIVVGWLESPTARRAQGCRSCHCLDHKKINDDSTGKKCTVRTMNDER